MAMPTQHDLDTIHGVLDAANIVVLTTTSPDGDLHSRPLALPKQEIDTSVSFLVQEHSETVADVRSNPKVNVAVQAKGSWLSLAGSGSVSSDDEQIDALWSAAAQAWFPEGREDDTIRVLTVVIDSAEYWADTDGRVASVVKGAKALFRRESPDIGENAAVEL